jgi:nitrogen regulatory protein PII
MIEHHENRCIELISVIVDQGMGYKIIDHAKKQGLLGGTITLAKGTVTHKILDFLGAARVNKEIVTILADQERAYQAMEQLDKELEFNKPNHGIAYSTTISTTMGTKIYACDHATNQRSEETMHQVITIIVDKGMSEHVIDAAVLAGSRGGTIISGRGSGIHEKGKLFSMAVEPEKETVIILCETTKTDAITKSIREHLDIDKPGNGIIYVQDINKTYGLIK